MNEFLDTGLAKICVALTAALCIIYILRIANKKLFKNRKTIISILNKVLRKYHKFIGITLIVIGLIHGLYSSQTVFSLNLGTACWIISIMLGLNFMFRKHFKRKGWIYYHRILTILFLAVLSLHILQMKGYIFVDKTYAQKSQIDIEAGTEQNNTTGSSENQSSTSDSSQGSSGSTAQVKYKDGTYTGTGTGFRPGLTVKVTVSGGKITNVDVTQSNDTGKFLNRASETVIQEITDSQTANVDAVSGATRSSNGIMEAVNNALEKAKQ